MATDKNFIVKNGLEVGGQEVISSSGVVTSAALGGQTLSSTDSPTFANLTVSNDLAVSGDLNLTGDLNITGDVNSLSVTDLDVTDQTITLGAGQVESASGGSGIVVAGSNASLLWDETNDEWDFNKRVNVTGAVIADGLIISGDSTIGSSSTTTNVLLDLVEPTSSFDVILGLSGHGSGRTQIRSTQGLGTSSDLRLLTVDSGNTKDRFKIASNGDISFYEDTGTTAKLFWDASTERLGLGTSLPENPLHISASTEPYIRIENTHSQLTEDQVVGGLIFEQNDSSGSGTGITGRIQMRSTVRTDNGSYFGNVADMDFLVSGAVTGAASDNATKTAMTIRAGTGYVGIGTENPERALHVVGGIHLANNNAISFDQGSGTLRNAFLVDSGDDIIIGDTNFDDIYFSTGQKTKTVVIKQTTGNVGIGTDNPDSLLEISGADDTRLKLTDTGDSSELMLRSDGVNTQIYTNTAHDLGIYTSGNVGQLHLKQSDGNVGIGTNSPVAKLSIQTPATDSTNNTHRVDLGLVADDNGHASGYAASGIRILGHAENSSGDKHTTFLEFNNRDPSLNGSHGVSSFITLTNPDAQGTYGTGQLDFYIRNNALYSFPNDPQTTSTYWMPSLMTIKSTGNVGIGTTSPNYKLEVNGHTGIRNGSFFLGTETGSNIGAVEMYVPTGDPNTIRVYRNVGAFGGTYSAQYANIDLYSGSTYGTRISGSGSSYFGGGNVGIGTNNPGVDLDVDSTVQNVFRLDTTNSDGPLQIFRNNGNVRGYIGNAQGILGQGTTNFGMRAQAALYFGTGGNNTRMVIESSGTILVGSAFTQVNEALSDAQMVLGGAHNSEYNTSGKTKLLISGADNDSPATAVKYIRMEDENGTIHYDFYAGTNGTAATDAHFDSNANINILWGTSTVGSITRTSSGTTYNTTSDKKLKENIEPIIDGKEKLLSMKPSTFNFIADEEKKKIHGFIAQEMQEIVPESVTDNDELLSMDYGRITPILVAALQDAFKEIEELKNKLESK